ncbi:MAG: hypothetical protein WC901_00820 [Candidatus Margulisiibacteriota bacterium]
MKLMIIKKVMKGRLKTYSIQHLNSGKVLAIDILTLKEAKEFICKNGYIFAGKC